MFRLKPTYIVEHVTDINLDDLKDEGIKGLIFDLDNTIMAPKTGEFTEDIMDWLNIVRNDFKIAIVSNNPHEEYIENASKVACCPAYSKAGKPRTGVAAKALKDLNLLPHQVAMVGDRPLTDVWMGQRLGLITILVDPLIKYQEIPIVKLLRKLERIFIQPAGKSFRQKGDR